MCPGLHRRLARSDPASQDDELLSAYWRANSNSAVTIYPTLSPFGINGGYYYAKLGMSF